MQTLNDPDRMRAALLYVLGAIEAGAENDFDKIHDAIAWGLGKQDIRNTPLRAALENKMSYIKAGNISNRG